jgi:hypothetical protein
VTRCSGYVKQGLETGDTVQRGRDLLAHFIFKRRFRQESIMRRSDGAFSWGVFSGHIFLCAESCMVIPVVPWKNWAIVNWGRCGLQTAMFPAGSAEKGPEGADGIPAASVCTAALPNDKCKEASANWHAAERKPFDVTCWRRGLRRQRLDVEMEMAMEIGMIMGRMYDGVDIES